MLITDSRIDAGKAFDWGRTSGDYAKQIRGTVLLFPSPCFTYEQVDRNKRTVPIFHSGED